MISSYNLPERGQLEIMDHWNKSYPPNDFEKARNEEIAKLQSGQRNPFIDFWNKPWSKGLPLILCMLMDAAE